MTWSISGGRIDENYQIEDGGEQQIIRLRQGSATLGDAEGIPTFLRRRQQDLSSVAQVVLDISSERVGEKSAGLAIYIDPLRYASLAFDFVDSVVKFRAINVPQRVTQETSYGIDPDTTALKLKIETDDMDCVMSFMQVRAVRPRVPRRCGELQGQSV